MARFNPIPYEHWVRQQLANTPDEERAACPRCDGTGHTECSECGHGRGCDRCDGVGTVAWGDLDEHARRRQLTRDRYHRAVLEDARAFSRFHDTDPLADLMDAGFRAWTRVRDRHLHIDRMEA